MARKHPKKTGFSNAYELFILVFTVLSLAIMVATVLPFSPATHQLLLIYDNLICFIFLVDFCLRITRATTPGHYFFHERGWLDLLGSIPSFGVFKYTALLRLARLSRLARILRLMRGKRRDEIAKDVLTHRGQYAAFITVLAAIIVLIVSSIVVLAFESASPDGNITTGGVALWWAIVTITTVGYGDHYPVTPGGRITAVFVMFMGIGIIGALASILASYLVAPGAPEEAAEEEAPPEAEPSPGAAPDAVPTEVAIAETAAPATVATAPAATVSPAMEEELRAIRTELEALRQLLGTQDTG